MANLRLVQINVIDSQTVKAQFTDELDALINTSNVTFTPTLPSVPTPSVLEVSVFGELLNIKVEPLTPLAAYFVTFASSSSTDFKSKDGTKFILEDGVTNAPLVLGPEDSTNSVQESLLYLLRGNVFSLEPNSNVRNIINSQATHISKALNDIKQAKNDNYLTNYVIDEKKERGVGPFDRLNEEGVFEMIRVGKQPAGATTSGTISFTEFPTGQVTLLRQVITSETLIAGTGSSTFDKLTLTVANSPVTKVTSIIFNYASGGSETYPITIYGYKLKQPKYDTDYASTLLTLDDDQIQLDRAFLDSGIISPVSGDTITIAYEYKSLGRVITENSVTVTQVLDATRESTPPIITEFTLDHNPIVTTSDVIATSGGVTFLDSQSNPPFSATHPAFATEIKFKYNGLPSNPGEYSIDYSSGRVFVYGETTNNGTGDYPPTATYKYRKSFVSTLDYTYDPTTSDLVANPLRDLSGETAIISFDYEESLVPGTDYEAQIHAEVLNERIKNRINSTNCISTTYTPITNVFRIYNETSGEVYRVSRWNDYSIYFTYTTPPNIKDVKRERVSFTDALDETLIVDEELTNIGGVRVFKILLEYDRIFSASEDVIGSSINSSATFSRTDIFETELYFDSQILSTDANINRLAVGQYQIDYTNGIVYLGVSSSRSYDVGTINYKNYIIKPQNSHIISVDELYNSISVLAGINKRINYSTVAEGAITPSSFDRADERFLNSDTSLPYIISSGTITVSDDVKSVRGIYDASDLNNNASPTNFATGATVSGAVIMLDSDGVIKQSTITVGAGLVVSVPNITSGAEIASVTSVTRVNDNVELYDGSATFSGYNITLAAGSGAVVGDVVFVTYYLALNSAATPIVDYDRGAYYADYTYLADEILVSYEYGDNVLDFRNSSALSEDEIYYASYKVGALRDALLKNFGSLVDVQILKDFDTTLPRERYRDAVTGALQSFTKGPTIPAITELVSSITHIDPEITEAAFNVWSLGVSPLYQNDIYYTEGVQVLPGKYDNGVYVAQDGYTVSFPAVSNLKLTEGTLETWVTPDWNGLDNDATLTFQVYKDGYLLNASDVYIGASSFNPTYDADGKFTVNRLDVPSPIGLPVAVYTSIGVFIYYDEDVERWKVLARDFVAGLDGYVYSGSIESSGEIYDAKFLPGLKEITDVMRSDMEQIYFEFHMDGYDVLYPDGYVDIFTPGVADGYSPGDGYVPGYSFDGITFMADDEHYIFDFGKTESTSRFSLYKDGRGYLNFRVLDNGSFLDGQRNEYKVSADISDWEAGREHHIAVAWQLNTADRRDEMHIFVDGAEMPNILRYGGRPTASSTDRFRAVSPEIVAGTVPNRTITDDDMTTTAGSPIVTSAGTNFATEGIVAGGTLTVLEPGFTTYNILIVNGRSLTLDANMPSTFSDARWSVNQYSVVVSSEINLASNIAVSIISGGVETEIPGTRAEVPGYSISKNALNQDVLTLLGDAQAGDRIAIRTLGMNHRRCRARQYVWGNTSNVIRTQLPPPISLDEANIYPVVMPTVSIGPANSVIVGGRFVAANLFATQPSNNAEGRSLRVTITGENVDFTNQPTVTIFGTLSGGAGFETLTFPRAHSRVTTRKVLAITSVTVEATPVNIANNSIAVEIEEAYPVTYSEGNNLYPVLRYSYQTQFGDSLEGNGSHVVSDPDANFVESSVGQMIVVSSPALVAGSYTITSRLNATTVTVTPTPAGAFNNGDYIVYDITLGRSGFQNGFFTLQTAGTANTPYPLNQGLYAFDYSAYLEIPFDPISNIDAHVGSDMNNSKPAKAIIDEMRILSAQLTDIRVGETATTGQDYITTDYTSLNPFTADEDTLALLHFDNLPLTNSADFYITSERSYLQSDTSVNSRFEKSLVITDTPLVVDNLGRLYTKSEGSIEFWVSPRFDTYNDPNTRFYFDASSTVVEEVTSITSGSVVVSSSISSVLSVRLQTDIDNTGIDYYAGGSIGDDFRTIRLNKALPAQQTPVKVSYISAGLYGDRLSIFKDTRGFLVFNVRASDTDYQVRRQIFWAEDTWHRVRVTWKFNRSDNQDEIRLFIDGEEGGVILFGSGLLFGQGAVFGQGSAGINSATVVSDINFTDPINQFYIGSDYLKANTAQARIDNLRISNISRNPLTVAGEPKDINYSSNQSIVYPVIEDLYTTYLLDFNTLITKNEDFALLRDAAYGIFNFDIDIIDSFDIVSSDTKVQQVLEELISALKPAASKVTLTYV